MKTSTSKKSPETPHLCRGACLTLCLALCLAPALNAHATNDPRPPRGHVIWEKGYEYVSIVANDRRPRGQHPANVPARPLQRALRSLKVRQNSGLFADRDKALPVFSRKTADLLGRLLASALRRARQNQDVLFRVGDKSSILGRFASGSRYTAGRAFWHRNRLHIIFGGIHATPKKRTLFGQEETAKLVGEPGEGSRTRETELAFSMIEAPGVAYATRKRRDWIAIRPDRIRTDPAPGNRAGDRNDIETRMIKLKRLYDRGLITEREYRTRKRGLLDEL